MTLLSAVSSESKQPHVARITARDDYETPPRLFNALDAVYDFEVDAAAEEKNALCDAWFADALAADWSIYKRIWCNPPFSNKEAFLQHALKFRNKTAWIVFLLPNNSRETKWWRSLVTTQADYVISLVPRVNYFLDGREIKGVPFSSCLAIYYPRLKSIYYGNAQELTWEWK